MHVIRLDHAAIFTADLATSVAFYRHFLGMKPGWRPPFEAGGAWLYPEGGDQAIVHLIEAQAAAEGGMFYHVAFRGRGLHDYLAKVKATGGWYVADAVPGLPLVQIQHRDPNGVLIEVNFEDEPIDVADVLLPPPQRGRRPISTV